MSTPEQRPVSFFSLFSRGQHYAKTWPLEKRLAPVFVENRVIRATRHAIRFMPPLVITREHAMKACDILLETAAEI